MADLEQLVAVQADRLDAAWVRERIVEMMGEDTSGPAAGTGSSGAR